MGIALRMRWEYIPHGILKGSAFDWENSFLHILIQFNGEFLLCSVLYCTVGLMSFQGMWVWLLEEDAFD